MERERRDMQAAVHPTMRRLSKPLACALALVALLFLLQVMPHGHANGQDEAACRLCQAAHVSVTPAISGTMLSVPLVPLGEITAPNVGGSTKDFFSHSPSRAPPVAVLI
ncbi:MAG: hypothetical protein WBL63_08470 [Candidatus Acidiferrum sp.]